MDNRTNNSIKNIKSGIIIQIFNKIVSFIGRSVFIHCLNTEYLGVNGLFVNILSILSFAELGIGSAIIYNMYKPVAEGDKEKIKSLMSLYKKSYACIGIIVFILGLIVMPFINLIVKDVPNINEDIHLLYFLFLLDTSASYFFTYKRSIIIAHQKQRLINVVDGVLFFIKSMAQIILLLMTKKYILYLLVQIVGTFLGNVIISLKANKMYFYLKDKKIKKLSKTETNTIFSNVRSLAIYQFGTVVMNGTDNLLISILIGVKTVGLCSNYILILNSIKQVLSSALSGITASIGNLNATSKVEKKEAVYNELTFLYYLIYSFFSISFICIINYFVRIWIGNDYLMGISVAISLGLTMFVEGVRMPGFMFRTTLGLFEKSRITPYIGAITNLLFSVLLCHRFGVVGIFLATSISQLMSYFWIDPFIIYKYDFKKSSIFFFKRQLYYFFSYSLILALCLLITNNLHYNLLINLLVSSLVVILIPNIANVLIYKNTSEFTSLYQRFLNNKNAIINIKHRAK